MRTLYVPIPEDVLARLAELARREFREPKHQAAALIVEGLRQAEERTVDAAATGREKSGSQR